MPSADQLRRAEDSVLAIAELYTEQHKDTSAAIIRPLLRIVQRQHETIEDLKNTVADMEERGGLRMRRSVG